MLSFKIFLTMPQLAYGRPRKTLFQLSVIPSGKKSEDTDHLTSPTEAALVGAALENRERIAPDQFFLWCLSLSLPTRGQTLTQTRRITAFMVTLWPNVTRSYCQTFDSQCRHSINIIPDFLFWTNITVSFPTPGSFLWGNWRRSHMTQSETRSFKQE